MFSMRKEGIEPLGEAIDRVDALAHALQLPFADSTHVECLRRALPEAVEQLKAAYVKAGRRAVPSRPVNAKKGCLLKKLFERDVRWTMKSGAGQILQAENLSPRLKADLLGLLLLCSTTQDKKPSLDVREKKKKSATA